MQGRGESGRYQQGIGTSENEDTVKKDARQTFPILFCFLFFAVSLTQGHLWQEGTRRCANAWAEFCLHPQKEQER